MASPKRRVVIEERLRTLTSGFGRYVNAYDEWVSSTSPQLLRHRQTIDLRREASSAEAAIASDDFLASLRLTLQAWGIGRRGSRLRAQGAFDAAVRSVGPEIARLDGLLIGDPALPPDVGERLWRLIESIGVVGNHAKLVAGTKTLHHLLPELVVPVDRRWTGTFFELQPSAWQAPARQRRAFLQMYQRFCEIARLAQPQQYLDGRLWQTSRTKVIDNALIGFCLVELTKESDQRLTDADQALIFKVAGFPPAKNEALSMLGAGHSHAPRVVALLSAAKDALQASGFGPVEGGPVALEVVVFAPPNRDAWDATNYLGGIADVLEEKSRRGALEHLGELRQVWVYRNDQQIKEVSYRQLPAAEPSYTVTIRPLTNPTER